jgi:dTDP-3-amino-3,4,6-trideoxy-alpha-D-glucose transaminase
MTSAHIPFLDVRPQEDATAVNDAIKRVIDSGQFILGPEVQAFEREFAEASALTHAVGVGNGTDALCLLLEGLGIGAGDEVITTALSAGFTAIAIIRSGATPVFVDIDEHRLTLDPAAVRSAITPRTAAIIPVHLYGQAADLTTLSQLATRHNLALIEDCCQAHLATYQGRAVGSFGHGCAFSFYPTKNLGALGDGGAACTNDAGLAERIRSLRNGGMSRTSYHEHAGINSRLDELQAAVLRARLPFLSGWTTKRRMLVARYRERLHGHAIALPSEIDPGHVYHLFPIRATRREQLREHLGNSGIDTVVHYPTPLPEQPAFKSNTAVMCPVAEDICQEIVSLPLHPQLNDDAVDRIIETVNDFDRISHR